MKKSIMYLLCLSVCLFADVVEMTGKWSKLEWNGYKPYPENVEENGVLHVSGITSQHGFEMKSKNHFKAKSGDTVVFHGTVKGRGRISLRVQCFMEDDRTWTGIAPSGKSVELPADWENIELTVPVIDMPKGMTGNVMVTYHLDKGGELFLKDSTISVEQGEYAGDVPFPRQFKVFMVGRHGENIDFPKDSIPEELYGVKPVDMILNNNLLDFSEYFNKRVLRENIVVYASIDSESVSNYTVGAGADYFMTYYFNGEAIIDTMTSGDGADKPHFTTHKANGKLKAGKNIIAIHVQTGRGLHPRISLGGPSDLRNISSIISITDAAEQDDYEKAMVRAGNPQVIQGILTDGMEEKTMQAIYPKGTVLTSGKAYTLPSKAGEKYFAVGLRICRFPEMGDIDFNLGELMTLRVSRRPLYAKDIDVSLMYQGRVQKSMRVPLASLPDDILLAVSPSEYCVNVASLNDSKLRSMNGKLNLEDLKDFQSKIVFNTERSAVDEYKLGIAMREVRNNNVPMKLDLAPEFDPVKAGWKLVWQDEFNGTEVDWEKNWMNSPWSPNDKKVLARRKFASVKDGKLHIRCEWKEQQKDGTYRGDTVGLYSRRHFGYGYYEARVRFTRKPGWWAAFWMHNEGRNCQLGGGYEIDIFEDYSTRGGEPIIASNLHVTRGPNQNSYGSHFKLPGTLDDFYVVGMKWTPFEVSTYINGKLVKATSLHTQLTSLTYNALDHAFCTNDLYISISGQAGSSGGRAKEPGEEEYIVDYVRAYEYPAEGRPSVSWTVLPKSCVKQGEKMRFEVEASPDAEVAYLYDNGFLVDYKTSKPYVFDWAIDKAHYEDTRWGTAGRSGVKPRMDGYTHIFRVCVQNAQGKVGMTEAFPAIMDIQPGKAEQVFSIPGAVKATAFNYGGHNVCSYKQEKSHTMEKGIEVHSRKNLHLREAGEYVSYTVDVKKAGRYKVKMSRWNYRREWKTRALVIADGKYVGTILGGENTDAAFGEIELHEGKQNLVIISAGTYGIQPDEFIFTLVE